MCTVLLPPGGYPVAVNYIISYHNLMKHEMLSDDVLISYADLWTVVPEGSSQNTTVIVTFKNHASYI